MIEGTSKTNPIQEGDIVELDNGNTCRVIEIGTSIFTVLYDKKIEEFFYSGRCLYREMGITVTRRIDKQKEPEYYL